MIREIILNSNKDSKLYRSKFICGCVYRSFNDLEAGVFFRFTNNGRLSKQQILDMIDRSNPQNEEKFMSIIDSFRRLDIIRVL